MKCNVICDNCGARIDSPYIGILNMQIVDDFINMSQQLSVHVNTRFVCPACGCNNNHVEICNLNKFDLEPIIVKEIEKQYSWRENMYELPFQNPIRGEK